MSALGAARHAGMVVGLLLALTAPAHASTVSATDERGDARKAIDIVKVEAVGDVETGLLVTATFRGNIERRLGRGPLKRAAVAMILQPRTEEQLSAGVITQGPGSVGQTLERTRSGDVGVVRDGKRLTFFIAGTGSENVGSIVVRVIPAVQRRAAATVASHQGTDITLLSAEDWLTVTNAKVREAAQLDYGPESTCADLFALRAKIKILRKRFERDAKKLGELQDDVERARKHVNQPRDKLTKLADRLIEAVGIDVEFDQARRDLALAERVVAKAMQLNRDMRQHLDELAIDVGAELDDRCANPGQTRNKPPVITRFNARFGLGDCKTCTLYYVAASDPEGGLLLYTWSKTPSTGDAAATNCGTFDWDGPTATWDHPNEGENRCAHEGTEHPGYITVVVTDDQGAKNSFTDPNGSADYDWQ